MVTSELNDSLLHLYSFNSRKTYSIQLFYLACICIKMQQLLMLDQIWSKTIPAIITLDSRDVADVNSPPPLVLELHWHDYICLYYNQIQEFFKSWQIYPVKEEEFYLTIGQQEIVELNSYYIVGNFWALRKRDSEEPIEIECHYRHHSNAPTLPQCINQATINAHFRNELKSSTATRYGNKGAKRLTLDMSTQNYEDMFRCFKNGDMNGYLGSEAENSDNLGFNFLIADSLFVPIRVITSEFILQRQTQKKCTLQSFIASLFFPEHHARSQDFRTQGNQPALEGFKPAIEGTQQLPKSQEPENQVLKKVKLYCQGVRMTLGSIIMQELQVLCHPDGYLYFVLEC